MSDYRDLSTRRLKRRYLRQIRKVWTAQRWGDLTTKDTVLRDSYRQELEKRGWEV